MARRYTKISGLGRCTIILDGINSENRQRVRLVNQAATGHIYLVHSSGSKNAFANVTGWPTFALLGELDRFNWWIPLSAVDDEGTTE